MLRNLILQSNIITQLVIVQGPAGPCWPKALLVFATPKKLRTKLYYLVRAHKGSAKAINQLNVSWFTISAALKALAVQFVSLCPALPGCPLASYF